MSEEHSDLVQNIVARLDADKAILDVSDHHEGVRSLIQNWEAAHSVLDLAAEAKWELFAIDMMAVRRSRRENESRERFAPVTTWISRDTDPPTTLEYPDVAGLLSDEQAAVYYCTRADTTPNPVLRARYADVAWTAMKRQHTLGAYRYGLIAAGAYLEQLPLCVSQRAHIELVDNLDRAAEIAVELNNRELASRVIEGAVDSLNQMAVADRARWVIEVGDTLLYLASRYPDLLGVETWMRVRQICDEGIGHFENEEHANPELTRRILYLASEIAENQKDFTTAWNYQVLVAESFYRQSRKREVEGGVTGGKLVAYKFMEDAMHSYQHLVSLALDITERVRLQERVDDAKRQMRRLLRGSEADMTPIRTEVDIPREKLEELIAPLLQADAEAMFDLLSGDKDYLPDIAGMRDWAKEATQKYPFSSFFGRITLRNGRKVDETSAIQGDSPHFFDYLGNWFQFHAHLLDWIFHRLRREGRFSQESFMTYLRHWEFLEETDAWFIEVGLERYFVDDHISALHVLTPRIEHMLKSAFEQVGLALLVVPDRRRVREQTFGDFLQRAEIRDILGENFWYYLQFAFVDERGLNIRNDVAHGWIRPLECNRGLVQIVLFAILLLTRLRRVEKPEAGTHEANDGDEASQEAAGNPGDNSAAS